MLTVIAPAPSPLRAGLARVAPVLLAAGGLLSCGDSPDPSNEHAAEVLAAVIRHVAAEVPPTVEEEEQVPVVYVVSVAETGLSASLQADVVSALRDDVDVRFADAREEAVEENEPQAPVPDGGVLLLVGAIEADAEPVDVVTEVYRDAQDSWKAVFTLAPGAGEEWRVTGRSELPVDAPT